MTTAVDSGLLLRTTSVYESISYLNPAITPPAHHLSTTDSAADNDNVTYQSLLVLLKCGWCGGAICQESRLGWPTVTPFGALKKDRAVTGGSARS